MQEQEVLQILGKVGAVITNSHIVYASGKHGEAYVNKDAVYPHTKETSRLCRAIAEQFADDGVETVVAPAIGGVILSQWTAYHLSEITEREVFGVYAEKAEGGDAFVIKRGYDKVVAGKNVLVVEDVLTTGGVRACQRDAGRLGRSRLPDVQTRNHYKYRRGQGPRISSAQTKTITKQNAPAKFGAFLNTRRQFIV
ncbi:MAG: Orotate phosphoribosyltransferase [Parcubacteria group bacterium GW2011_GWA2_47_9]|nr:MAG: Orotate phosphoribosyltransferase [Parcubacteria group bacterium GW2011_GWA2_47_9]